MQKVSTAAFAAAMAIGFAASPAHAQLDQTWVASNGLNTNTCSVSQPCADFATAISKTNAGGKISCLTSGQYGGFSITKAITVDCQGVDALANAAINITVINITVPGGTRIVLRGLHVTADPSTIAIAINQGGILDVEDCLIEGAGNGIVAFSTNATEIRMTNTSILNSGGSGFVIVPSGGPVVTAVINRSKSSGNNNGVRVMGASGATTRVQIIDSILTDNVTNGVEVTTGVQPATVVVTGSLISSNTNIGVHSSGGAAAVILNGTTITNNATALSADSGGAIFSYGNNAVNDNGSPGSAPTPVALR